MQATTHNIIHDSSDSGRFVCIDCRASVGRTSPNIVNWLKSPCVAVPFDDSSVPVLVPGWFRIQIGNNIPHCSHEIMSIKGIIFCKACGAYRVKKCKLLLHPCLQQCSVSSQRARDKLLQAQLPTKLMSWPRTRCQLIQPRAERFLHETCHIAQTCATDTPCDPAIPTAFVGRSIAGRLSGSESCERTREFVSHFDNPELDCLFDESDL